MFFPMPNPPRVKLKLIAEEAICLGGRLMGTVVAWDLVEAFLAAEFSQGERHLRRLSEVAALEKRTGSEVGASATAIPA